MVDEDPQKLGIKLLNEGQDVIFFSEDFVACCYNRHFSYVLGVHL